MKLLWRGRTPCHQLGHRSPPVAYLSSYSSYSLYRYIRYDEEQEDEQEDEHEDEQDDEQENEQEDLVIHCTVVIQYW